MCACVAAMMGVTVARELIVQEIFRTRSSPPEAVPVGDGDHVELHVPAGIVGWRLVQWLPNAGGGGMHYTDTIDFDVVIAGSIVLVLNDGPHELQSGDCVVVAGVDHGWRAGPSGCTMSVLVLGTARR